MSGKAPPRGPRALLGSLPHQQSPQSKPGPSSSVPPPSSSHSQPSRSSPTAPTSSPTNRIGAAPPTGPRSLTNGRQPPSGPKHLVNGRSSPSALGPNVPTGPHALQSNRYPISIKGKTPDKPSADRQNQSTWPTTPSKPSSSRVSSTVNGSISSSSQAHPTTIESSSSAGGSRAAISISMVSSKSAAALAREKLVIPSPFLQQSSSRDHSTPSPTAPTQPSSSSLSKPPPPASEPPPPPPPPSQPPPLPTTQASSLPSLSTPSRPEPPPPPSSIPHPPPASTPPLPLPPHSSTTTSLSPIPQNSSEAEAPSESKPAHSLINVPSPVVSSSVPSQSQLPTELMDISHAQSQPQDPPREPTSPPPRPPSPEELVPPPLPSWPPSRSAYPSSRSYKVLYDPAIESSTALALSSLPTNSHAFLPSVHSSSHTTHTPSYYRSLIEHVRKHAGSAALVQERIRGKGKGKEALYRFEGEVVRGVGESGMVEEEVVVKDPRKDKGFLLRHQLNGREKSFRPARNEFHEFKWEYDANSTGPRPPTSVLIVNISPLTPNQLLRRHFSIYGTISSFEPQIDKENGGALGILFIRYSTHEEAKRCVERENGRPSVFGVGVGPGMGAKSDHGEELKAVLDGEGLRLKAVMKLLEERKKREREERRRREKGVPPLSVITASGGASSHGKTGATPNATVQTPLEHTPRHQQLTQPARLSHGLPVKPVAAAAASPQTTTSTTTSQAGTVSGTASLSGTTPAGTTVHATSSNNSSLPEKPMIGNTKSRPPPALVKARMQAMAIPMNSTYPRHGQTDGKDSSPSSSTPAHGGSVSGSNWRDRGRTMYRSSYRPALDRYLPSPAGRDTSWERDRERDRDKDRDRDRDRDRERDRDRGREWDTYLPVSPMDGEWSRSRSPSPRFERGRDRKEREKIKVSEREKEHDAVLDELARNGKEHVRIPVIGSSVREEDVRTFFDGFKIDKVLKDHLGWYVTFTTADSARRSSMVLSNSTTRMLAYQSVNITVHPAPPLASRSLNKSARWDENELLDQAQRLIIKELRTLLEKDIMDRVVGPNLRVLISKERNKEETETTVREMKPVEKRSLKGLSFKKQPKKVEVKEVGIESETEDFSVVGEGEREQHEEEEEEAVIEPPKKKRKKESLKAIGKMVPEELVESEDEEGADLEVPSETIRKRAISEDREPEVESEPVKKKQKVEVVAKVKKAPVRKRATKKKAGEKVEDVVFPNDLVFDIPALAKVRFTPGLGSLSPEPDAKHMPRVVTPPPTPPPDPMGQGLCNDDEDLYFLRLALSGYVPPASEEETDETPEPPGSPTTFRKHITGSARTEGFYKISHAEKAAYVAQYQARVTAVEVTVSSAEEPPPPQHVTSSRSNRANARRRAQGLEEINQVQRAVALSKGETAVSELNFKFNQLQTRKKYLRFARSPIHDWGLYAMEKISRGEMVIEYVGEIIRAQVADKREKAYERQGIGSSYLFRIDEDLVVDATKKGNLGRLINHSCDPNCTAKIITISGEKKIVIYAKQDIELGDEITYDYHFPFEQDKIPCLCGSAKCRGYLN